MKKNRRQINRNKELLPVDIIENAASGDVEALHKILEHYEGYIRKLSTKVMYDEYGNVHYWMDEELKRRLEIRLITTTLKFRIEKPNKRVIG